LKRARNALELARFMYENAEINHAETLKFEIPRQDEQMKQAAAQAEITWQTTRNSLPLALKKLELETAKMKIERERSEEKLRKLLADRAAMVVKAPVDGVVYYGACEGGKVTSAAAMEKKLRLGGAITPHEVAMTIVQSRPMFVRSTLAENHLAKVAVGDRCRVVPTGYPDEELSGVVSDLSGVPVEAGKFDLRITLAGNPPAALVPGMTCKVKLETAEEGKQAGADKAEEKGKDGVEKGKKEG
jgi:multidrug resistance efflux pump